MSQVGHVSIDAPNAIAIVGMSGRFPGAPGTEALWANLVHGVESIRRFTADDLAAEGISPRLLDQSDHVSAGGDLADVDQFDAAFFGFSPREAEILDPQHRIFLECAWEALETAGHPPSRFPGSIGVYAGAGASTHLYRLLGSTELVRSLGTLQITIGNEKDHLSTRTAYKLGLRGPAVTVQTTCSSSLVAVTLACDCLRAGQCDLALAGGVSIVLPQHVGYRYRSGGILSPDGHCRAFDAEAAGAVGGNGAAVVALRRLSDSVRDGDHILAVIRGSAVNNDGSVKVGYTAPGIDGQAAAIRQAHTAAGIPASAISYVEAHGTGTALGDPIEVAALTEAFGERTPRAAKTCLIGSLKTNIGHLDAAAGAAGLIKVVLALNHDVIPPSLHFREPNPELRLDETPFAVVAAPTPWPTGDGPRLAGVSSFGIGGTNAHIVVEEAPTRTPSPDVAAPLLIVSARTAAAADRACAQLADHLERHPEVSLSDAAFTLQAGRHFFRHRRAVVGADRASVITALRRGGRARISGVAVDEARVAFLLPGQGSQRPGMGSELYHSQPAYRAELDACCDALTPLLGLDLRDLLAHEAADKAAAAQCLQRTELAQPALFAVEMALAAVLAGLGVRPAAMIGHSLGELVAACLAGVFSREDALALVAARGQLMAAAAPGAMLAVPLGEEELHRMLIPGVEIAAANAPAQSTVSGPFEAIKEFGAYLEARGITAHQLHVSHAFHCASMQEAAADFASAVAAVPRAAPKIAYLSNVTGTWITDQRATDPSGWGEHIRGRVRFADGARALLDTGAVLVEVGPGGALIRLAGESAPAGQVLPAARLLPGAGEADSELRLLADAVGRLWVAGVDVDWTAYAGNRPPRRVLLPTYPFERSRFWIDVPAVAGTATGAPRAAGDGHGQRRPADEWISVPSWRRAGPVAPAATPTSVAVLGVSAVAERLADELSRRGCAIIRGAEPARCRGADLVADLRALRPGPLDALDLFEPVVQLVRILTAAPAARRQRLLLVTDRAVDVTGDEQLRPAGAVLHGLARVIGQEHPGLSARTLDVLAPQLDQPAAISQLADELCGAADPSAALRNGHRWLPGFALVPSAPPEQGRLRPGGTYLITGGLGRVGLSLADRLASTGASLALVARTELPPRDRWAAAAEQGAASTGVLRRLYAMERRGARVLPLTADVSDPAAMFEALTRAIEQFGPLDGVIHAAGAVGPDAFAPIVSLDRALIRRHFTSKIVGAQVLDELLGQDVPPLAIFTSSLSAELGGLGYGAYAAANAFLDAFAAGPGRGRWTSVGWEGWRFGPAGASPASGLASLALTPAEAAEVFARIACLPTVPRLIVSTGDMDQRVRSWVQLHSPALPETAAAAGHARPELDTDYAGPANDVERAVASAWQELLGIEGIGRDDDFFALGGHSLLAIQLISRLRDAFGVELSLRSLFDGPTVAEVARLVAEGRAAAAIAADQRLAELLDLVEGMSEAEVEALLAADEVSPDG